MMEQIKGAKYDEGKPRPSLVPVAGIEAIMQVREFGKAKYADAEDWRKVPREKWLDALLRHVLHIWDIRWRSTMRAAYRLCGML